VTDCGCELVSTGELVGEVAGMSNCDVTCSFAIKGSISPSSQTESTEIGGDFGKYAGRGHLH